MVTRILASDRVGGHTIPMSPIEPVYLTAGGALIGALLTILVQVIIARLNRKHDKLTKTYDIRLALYSELEAVLEKMPKLRQKTDEALEETRTVQAERAAHRAAIIDLTGAVEALVAGAPTDSEGRRKDQGARRAQDHGGAPTPS
jgi:hypothetical protein